MNNKITKFLEVFGDQLNKVETLLIELLKVCQRESRAAILQRGNAGGIMVEMKVTHS